MRNIFKPALMVALTASMFTGAQAQSLRKFGNLNLNNNQRAQIRQILNSGDRRNPATRQRMQQQIMTVLTPQQQNQLAYELQRRNGTQTYNYSYNPNLNNGYNNGCYNNNAYYNNGTYNNGYYNNGYYNNGNTMQSLINSGILNGVLQTLINR